MGWLTIASYGGLLEDGTACRVEARVMRVFAWLPCSYYISTYTWVGDECVDIKDHRNRWGFSKAKHWAELHALMDETVMRQIIEDAEA
jgi:hypothetical protein